MGSRMDKLYIVMPAYNEEANIIDVVKNGIRSSEGTKNEESRLVDCRWWK